MTYMLLNTVFFALLAVIVMVARKRLSLRGVLVTLGAVVALTAVFDPIMIAVGLVDYDSTKLLGLYWFGAPLEDFAYSLFAVPFVACLWHILERND